MHRDGADPRPDEPTAAPAASAELALEAGRLEDVARAVAGELAAFERLYRATVARIHGLARRILGPEHADEATQEVYLRAWLRLGSFRGEASFATWLHRLATNEILNLRQRLGREGARSAAPTSEAPERGSTSAGTRQELRLDLEAGLEDLPDGAREVFVLHDVEGLNHGEIARRLGVSVGTSKSQLHRARQLLRVALFDWTEADHDG